MKPVSALLASIVAVGIASHAHANTPVVNHGISESEVVAAQKA